MTTDMKYFIVGLDQGHIFLFFLFYLFFILGPLIWQKMIMVIKYFIVGLGQVHIFLIKRITPFSGVFRRFMAFFINFTSFFILELPKWQKTTLYMKYFFCSLGQEQLFYLSVKRRLRHFQALFMNFTTIFASGTPILPKIQE